MVTPIDEDVTGNDKQLAAALVARQSVAAPVRGRNVFVWPSAAGRSEGTSLRCLGEIAHQSSI
ncbi:hypothetical protein GuangZ0019_1195 [Mycobacterium tuberculosis GuangZ0019]|nr:hypothetical protein GuangZ0019_1195 [Mycobacterium tuberculosis GuangZ0019]KAF3397674.1 hypothetical protein BIT18_2894 [Mycobacterium tuberculosis variant bovis]